MFGRETPGSVQASLFPAAARVWPGKGEKCSSHSVSSDSFSLASAFQSLFNHRETPDPPRTSLGRSVPVLHA